MKNANLKKRFRPFVPTLSATASTASCGQKNATGNITRQFRWMASLRIPTTRTGPIQMNFLSRPGMKSLADHITPEDFLHAKELLDLIIKHFGYGDAAVALGCKSRQAEAERLNITHDAYCKRLQRKIGSFKVVLKEAGYL